MTYDYNKLRGRIIEKFRTIGAFADDLGVTTQTVSAKLNNKNGFSQEDIELWSEHLDIDRYEYPVYFFKREVQ